jgi:hypothetical protein
MCRERRLWCGFAAETSQRRYLNALLQHHEHLHCATCQFRAWYGEVDLCSLRCNEVPSKPQELAWHGPPSCPCPGAANAGNSANFAFNILRLIIMTDCDTDRDAATWTLQVVLG